MVARLRVFAEVGCCCVVGFGDALDVDAFPLFKGEEAFVCGGSVGGFELDMTRWFWGRG